MLTGEIPSPLFGLLCRLDAFNFSDNPNLGRNTLTGHLVCTLTNLKNATEIDASDQQLEGKT